MQTDVQGDGGDDSRMMMPALTLPMVMIVIIDRMFNNTAIALELTLYNLGQRLILRIVRHYQGRLPTFLCNTRTTSQHCCEAVSTRARCGTGYVLTLCTAAGHSAPFIHVQWSGNYFRNSVEAIICL